MQLNEIPQYTHITATSMHPLAPGSKNVTNCNLERLLACLKVPNIKFTLQLVTFDWAPLRPMFNVTKKKVSLIYLEAAYKPETLSCLKDRHSRSIGRDTSLRALPLLCLQHEL
jgi:hypothetical protein